MNNNNFKRRAPRSEGSSFGDRRQFSGPKRAPSHNGFSRFKLENSQTSKTNFSPRNTPTRQETSERSERNNTFKQRGFGRTSGSFGGRGRFQNKFSNQKRGGRRPSKGIDISRLINKEPINETPVEYKNKHQFADFMIDEKLKANVVKKGYVTPTAIQDQSIPVVLEGNDVVGLANTGTGKTAAFLIPLIDKIIRNNKEKVLVVVPTRELAIQIEKELKDFTVGLPIWGVVCVGGAFIVPQIKSLSRQHNFVIGTPGRLKDLIERKNLKLNEFQTVVLDEADRMLDMGFVGDIKYMMALMPEQRQTLFFSATTTPEIDVLISKFLKNPVKVSVRTGNTSKSVAQDVVRVVAGDTKIQTLERLLKTEGFEKVLVFGRTKHGVEKLTEDLNKRGIKAESIHGNKTHGRRQKALTLFREHHVQVLVATDVAARGLDISGVTHVINYDLPDTYEDYVHRIGRTGRGGKTGIALSFVE